MKRSCETSEGFCRGLTDRRIRTSSRTACSPAGRDSPRKLIPTAGICYTIAAWPSWQQSGRFFSCAPLSFWKSDLTQTIASTSTLLGCWLVRPAPTTISHRIQKLRKLSCNCPIILRNFGLQCPSPLCEAFLEEIRTVTVGRRSPKVRVFRTLLYKIIFLVIPWIHPFGRRRSSCRV